MIGIIRSSKFEKMYLSLVKENSKIKRLIKTNTKLFSNNPADSRLKTHALRKRLKGKFSFSVDDDIRIIFEWVGKNTTRFLAIGTHAQVYIKKKPARS